MQQFTSHSAGLKANDEHHLANMQWMAEGSAYFLPYAIQPFIYKNGKLIPPTMKAYITLRDNVSQGFIKRYVIKP
jgi:hypothetical protein